MKLVFRGITENTFSCTGPNINIEKNVNDIGPIFFRIDSHEGSLIVYADNFSSPSDGWIVGLGPAFEQYIPKWTTTLSRSRDEEFIVLTMVVADDATVTLLDVNE